MNMNHSIPPVSVSRFPGWRYLIAIAIISAAGLLLTSCKPGAAAKPPDVDYYTCTMHPSVKKQHPTDKCPICSMDLVPVKKKQSGEMNAPATTNENPAAMAETAAPTEEKPTEFTVASERQQQIGVTYATVERQPFRQTIRAVGTVAYDKQRHWDYVTRVEGYV